VQDAIALDVAEFELLERERAAQETASLPGASEAPATDTLPVVEDELQPLHTWRGILTALPAARPLHEIVPTHRYAETAYRLSLLGLLGDPESAALDGPAADLARLPLRLEVGLDHLPVEHPEIVLISEGRLIPVESR
jgi:hypothetical protein